LSLCTRGMQRGFRENPYEREFRAPRSCEHDENVRIHV
jgi:hypothetical protein